MTLQTSFDVLSRVVEQYESSGRSVRHVEATTDEEGETLRVSMEVPVSLCAASDERVQSVLTPETATLAAGGLQVKFSTSPLGNLPQSVATVVSTSEEAVRVADDGVVLTVELSIDPSEADGALSSVDDRRGVGLTPAGFDSGTETDESAVQPPQSDDAAMVETATGPARAADRADALSAVRDESVPPYEDVPYLERLYDVCDTFAEMSQLIEMDVSSETVRRYMIEADVHDPASYDVVDENEGAEASDPEPVSNSAESASSESDGERLGSESATDQGRDADATAETEPSTGPSEATDSTGPETTVESRDTGDPMDRIPERQLVTDGSGLPPAVDLRDVAEAVVESMTVYEVQQRLDLDRKRTTDLLKRLNLIDLTMRRVADAPEEPVSYEQVAARIRQCAPGKP